MDVKSALTGLLLRGKVMQRNEFARLGLCIILQQLQKVPS